MQRRALIWKWVGRIAAFFLPAGALIRGILMLLRELREYGSFDPWELVLLAIPALTILRLVFLFRSKRKKALRSVLLSLLCLPVLFLVAFVLSASFCATVENYGVRLPDGGRVARSCGFTVGFDRTEIQELDYGGSVPETGFPWKAEDPEADEILERIVEALRDVDARRPLENMALVTEIEAKGAALLSYVVKNEPGDCWCLILYDPEAQVLYLCEMHW